MLRRSQWLLIFVGLPMVTLIMQSTGCVSELEKNGGHGTKTTASGTGSTSSEGTGGDGIDGHGGTDFGDGGFGGAGGMGYNCGNGTIDPGEVCDDNDKANDRCTDDCMCGIGNANSNKNAVAFRDSNKDCYVLFKDSESKNWISSLLVCESEGMSLATVTNINSLVDNMPKTVTTNQFWIGANDIVEDEIFTWANGDKFNENGEDYWQTNPKQPDHLNGEDCVELTFWSSSSKWGFNDKDCGASRDFLCKRKP